MGIDLRFSIFNFYLNHRFIKTLVSQQKNNHYHPSFICLVTYQKKSFLLPLYIYSKLTPYSYLGLSLAVGNALLVLTYLSIHLYTRLTSILEGTAKTASHHAYNHMHSLTSVSRGDTTDPHFTPNQYRVNAHHRLDHSTSKPNSSRSLHMTS